MSSAYCSEPCTHMRCGAAASKARYEAWLEVQKYKNQASSIGCILLDTLHAMKPENRMIIFDVIIRDFCIRCGHNRKSGVCGCP